MTDLEIQKYIEENCRYPDGSSAMDEQAFYEGAKWYRDYVVNKLTIPVVVKSLPTDECVEQWWTEGKDQQKGFWKEAPYRTNGDVVEEIKTALKYFIETWQR